MDEGRAFRAAGYDAAVSGGAVVSTGWRGMTLGWTLLATALLAHHASLWVRGFPIETDVLALLPSNAREPLADKALARVNASNGRTVIVLLGAKSADDAIAAQARFVEQLPPGLFQPQRDATLDPRAALEGLWPSRGALLTPHDAARLDAALDGGTEDLAARALLLLQQPVSVRTGSFRDDPLQLFSSWLQARLASTPVRPVNGVLMLEADGKHFAVLRLEVVGSGFSLSQTPRLASALQTARAALSSEVDVTFAGVPLLVEAASVQASGEINTIGTGSLLAILLVMFLAFRSLRPLVLVVVSVGMGVIAGLSACVLVFGKVHLLTLVFGASLVGVAEDYGIHYFASRQAEPNVEKRALLRSLTPGLFLALLTSVAGFAMLALTPLPGLRQVALFSSVGLAAAFLCVLGWFPSLDGVTVKQTAFATAWAATRARWPMLGLRAIGVLTVAVLALGGVAMSRVHVDDDVRTLQSVPTALLEQQLRVAKLLGLPSPAQVFFVRGNDAQQILEREEQLTAQLRHLVDQHVLTGFEALSNWVPSHATQSRNLALSAAANAQVLDALKDGLEEEPAPPMPGRVLELQDALASSTGEVLRPLWLDTASVVLLRGLGREGLPALRAIHLEGVSFVDRTQSLTELLSAWRVGMSWLLGLGYVFVFAALWLRFRRRAWRALLPTALASIVAFTAVVVAGEALSLFHVLALWLLLGMGVDYGIFLVEHPSRQAGEAWLAVGLGAVSTFLSFGLLAVSRTPAIHAFGLTLAVGLVTVWALSPMLAGDES